MPTLNWIGKDAVIKHAKEVKFHLLEPVTNHSCAADAKSANQRISESANQRISESANQRISESANQRISESANQRISEHYNKNLIIHGDNLLVLKALLPRYSSQVKCIYIDPPYNTGNEGWIYNDNVNNPEIRRWLGEVVGKEGETLDRHDRWLCMMYPRLVLLRQFLREDGVIFVSIDDNEVANLRLLMDEIFGANRFIGDVIWQHSVQAKGYSGTLSLHHNHTLIYGKGDFRLGDLARTEAHNVNYSNPDNDPKGPWRSGDIRNALVRPNLMYDIVTPSGNTIKHPPKGWRFSKETLERELAEGKIIFSKDQTKIIRKIYLADQSGRVPESIWFSTEAGTTREATAEVASLLGNEQHFDTPKPTRLIQRILQIATDKDSLVLDSFAGSGTTAHAVLKQNAEDGGQRRFILVEMDRHIAENVTAERVRRVAEGYTNGKGQAVAGLGGGFQFCRLSAEPLFRADGQIREDVTFAQLAEFVWFAETGTGFAGKADSPLLGIHEGRAIYLLFNGILKDKTPRGGNVLTAAVYACLPPHSGAKVIYAAANRMGSRTAREGITFKQTPYALEV